MYLKETIDIAEFLKKVMSCQNEVYFETADGDSLALKSALSQYIFCSVASEKELLNHGLLRFENPEDAKLLADYITTDE